MSGLGSDIAEVLSEVGVPYTLLKPDGSIGASGFLDTSMHPEHTTVAIRELFITGTLPETTEAEPGDILELPGDLRLVLTTKLPEYFEGVIIDYLFASWACNIRGKFQRHSDEPTYNSDFEPVTLGWVDTTDLIYTAQIPVPSARSQFQRVQDYFYLELNHELIYVSDSYDVISGDRWWVSDSVYFHVEFVSETLLSGLKVCTLKHDSR